MKKTYFPRDEDDVEVVTEPQRSRKTLLIGIISIASLIALGSAFAFFGTGLTPVPHSGTDMPSVESAPPAPATEQGALPETDAELVVEHILVTPIEPVETSQDLEKVLTNVAAGDYFAELEAQWQELSTNGWTIEGTPEVLSTEVGQIADGQVEVIACVDSSRVRMLDADGQPIGENSVPPARHLFTLKQGDDDTWRIISHSFPDDPAC